MVPSINIPADEGGTSRWNALGELSGMENELNREQELRALCDRLFGFASRQAAYATQVLLDAAERRVTVALRGDCDLIPIAYSLHRRLLGPEKIFCVADPRRVHNDGNVKNSRSRSTALAALEAAGNGSVCLHSLRLPDDFKAFAEQAQAGRQAGMVFMCLYDRHPVRDLLCRPLDIPPLGKRGPELDRVLAEYLADAASALGVPDRPLSPKASREVVANVVSIPEMEETALRIVALLSEPRLPDAATRLGMATVSLSRWVDRRSWILSILDDPY
jgi:hypothetical protein